MLACLVCSFLFQLRSLIPVQKSSIITISPMKVCDEWDSISQRWQLCEAMLCVWGSSSSTAIETMQLTQDTLTLSSTYPVNSSKQQHRLKDILLFIEIIDECSLIYCSEIIQRLQTQQQTKKKLEEFFSLEMFFVSLENVLGYPWKWYQWNAWILKNALHAIRNVNFLCWPFFCFLLPLNLS